MKNLFGISLLTHDVTLERSISFLDALFTYLEDHDTAPKDMFLCLTPPHKYPQQLAWLLTCI